MGAELAAEQVAGRRLVSSISSKTFPMKEVPAPSSADVATMREMAERAGLQVTVGG